MNTMTNVGLTIVLVVLAVLAVADVGQKVTFDDKVTFGVLVEFYTQGLMSEEEFDRAMSVVEIDEKDLSAVKLTMREVNTLVRNEWGEYLGKEVCGTRSRGTQQDVASLSRTLDDRVLERYARVHDESFARFSPKQSEAMSAWIASGVMSTGYRSISETADPAGMIDDIVRRAAAKRFWRMNRKERENI